jgi:N-carbamoylputrescine amidase
MTQKVILGLIQMKAAQDPVVNLAKAVERLEQAASEGAQILCLQELFRSLYFPQSEDHKHFSLSESIPGPTTEALSRLAEKKSVVIIAPIFEKRTEGVYHNSAVVIDADGKLLGTYRKMHIPDDPHFYEKFYFAPGDLGFQAYQTHYARIGVLICWDQWFPEAARLTALRNAQILFYPTAIGWHESEPKDIVQSQLEGWEVIQRGHAVANEVFVAVTNRVGREGKLTFWGNSFTADPFGKVLRRGSQDKEENLIMECDLAKIEETRQHWPFFRDRRVDAYGSITARFLDER